MGHQSQLIPHQAGQYNIQTASYATTTASQQAHGGHIPMPGRRKVVIGLGALTAGTAAAIGTTMFTTTADPHTIRLAPAGDGGASLQLEALGDTTVTETDDGWRLTFTGAPASATNELGSNTGGPAFLIQNQGTDPVVVTLDPESVPETLRDDGQVQFFTHFQLLGSDDNEGDAGDSGAPLIGDPNDPGQRGVILAPGTAVPVRGQFTDVETDDLDAVIDGAAFTIVAVSDGSEGYPGGGPSDNSAGVHVTADGTLEDTGS